MLRRVTAGALVALVSIWATAAIGAQAPLLAGTSCTYDYPRGFKVPRGTKKKPLKICTGGDLQTTWGAVCVPRYTA